MAHVDGASRYNVRHKCICGWPGGPRMRWENLPASDLLLRQACTTFVGKEKTENRMMRMNGKCVLRCMAIAALASMASCHSTEANYKAAYDKAVDRTKDGVGLEVYNKVLEERNRDNYIVNGDSLRMVLDRCNIVDGKPDEVRPYGVVVAEFKQKFNATSLRNRLRTEEKLPAYVVFTGSEQKYCVVASGFDEAADAAAFVKNISKKMKIKPLVPKVWVLQRI